MGNPHVTFIHGIANKPAKDELVGIWLRSLSSDQRAEPLDLSAEGVTHGMCYWADVMYEGPEEIARIVESAAGDATSSPQDEDLDWTADLSAEEQAFVQQLRGRLDFDQTSPGDDKFSPPVSETGVQFERVPLPWFVKRRLMKALLRDVHHYLFNTEHSPRTGVTYQVRDEIRSRALAVLAEGAEKAGDNAHVVVSHSMGTVIAYDCLKRVAECPPVTALMTIGSPLGLDEVQDKLHPEGENQPGWSREDGFPAERVSSCWVNVYDRLDPVAGFDPKLANDYRKSGADAIVDVNEQNSGRWRHSIDKYLSGDQLREHLRDMLGF